MTKLLPLRYLLIPYLLAGGVAPAIAHAEPGDALVTIEKREDIKVVYDVKQDEWSAGIGKALYYVRGLLEAYKSQGVAPEQLHISVVVHSKPVYWMLNEDAYQDYKNDPFANNPNQHVIESLLEHGVSLEVCNVTMKSMGWTAEDILPGVKVVHDGYTRLIDLQQRGYAYIRF